MFVNLGELERAAQDWEAYLRRCPEASDADSVRVRLRRVRLALATLN